MKLPHTENELRDLIIAAWEDGWSSRKGLIGKPAGDIHPAHKARRNAYLLHVNLPVPIEPPPVPIREAIQRMAGLKDGDQ